MKSKLILVISIILNIISISIFIIYRKGFISINYADRIIQNIDVQEQGAELNVSTRNNSLELILNKETNELIDFYYSLPDLSQTAVIETDNNELKKFSYHGKDYSIAFVKINENTDKKDFSLAIYKHKIDNPFQIDYQAQLIFNINGEFEIVE